MLVNISPIQPGDTGSPNLWNSRFAAITSVINGNIDSDNIKDNSITASKVSGDTFDRLYPVGSVYINATNATNPESLLGFGTWVRFGEGRVPVGYDSEQTEFNSPEKTGGHKELQAHTHTGTTNNAGSHTHGYTGPPSQTVLPIHGSGDWSHGFNDGTASRTTGSSGNHSHSFTTASSGGGDSGNLQPYVVVYMWKRIS